jgi:hypothetical protein
MLNASQDVLPACQTNFVGRLVFMHVESIWDMCGDLCVVGGVAEV